MGFIKSSWATLIGKFDEFFRKWFDHSTINYHLPLYSPVSIIVKQEVMNEIDNREMRKELEGRVECKSMHCVWIPQKILIFNV